MITIALDLSIASTGICIANDADRTCTFYRLTDKAYARDMSKSPQFVKATTNGIGIADAIAKILMPYRFETINAVIESVGFGLLRSRTNSVTTLLFEGGIVAATLRRLFNANVQFVEPTKHKKLFTGNGKASKEQSIQMLLHWFPVLAHTTDKLDDMADAMSIMTSVIPDIRTFCPKVICI